MGRKVAYRSEAHVLDVIELALNALPGTTAVVVVAGLAGSINITVGTGESIGHDLVDALGAPEVGVGSERRAGEGRNGHGELS